MGSNTCPDGWQVYNQGSGRFLFGTDGTDGNDIPTGFPGGSASHSHLRGRTDLAGGGRETDRDQSDLKVADPSHWHTFLQVSESANMPPFVPVIFCITNTSVSISFPASSDAVIAYAFPATCPTGWKNYDRGTGRFLRGIDDTFKVEYKGGKSVHSHSGKTHETSGKGVDRDGDFLASEPEHSHSFMTSEDDHIPEFVAVSYCIRVGDTGLGSSAVTGLPDGSIMAFRSESCPEMWDEYEPAQGKFLRGIDSSSEKNGDTENWHHQHSGRTNTIILGATHHADRGGDFSASEVKHQHIIKITDEEIIPPYIGVLFCRYGEVAT